MFNQIRFKRYLSAWHVFLSSSCFYKTSEVNLPATSQGGVETLSRDQSSIAIEKQVHWLKHCEHHLNEKLTKGVLLSRAAYHASVTELPNPSPCLSSFLPLFYKKATTVAMMKHGLFVIIRRQQNFLTQTKFLSLYVIILFLPVQKLSSETGLLHTEKMFTLSTHAGVLHIEMGLWTICGGFLAASGWNTALRQG